MMCASRGFKIHYLGPDLPAQLQALVAELGPGAAVWVGGSAAQLLDKAALPDGCVCVRDQLELDRRLDMLAA
jgi:hypothetical protein